MERYSTSKGGITFDESNWPIVHINYGEYETDEWQEHALFVERLLNRREPFALINNLAGVRPPGATERRIISDCIAKRREDFLRYLCASAGVQPSALARGAMTAIQWVSPPPFPFKVFATVEEAEAWALRAIGERMLAKHKEAAHV